MNKKSWAIGLAGAGLLVWFFPGWNGFLFPASDVSAGQGQITGAILFVGALLLWFLPNKD